MAYEQMIRDGQAADHAKTISNELAEYARLTASDNHCDRAAAVRMMSDEIAEVSRETGIHVDEIREWIRAQG